MVVEDYCKNSTQTYIFKGKRFEDDYKQFSNPGYYRDTILQDYLRIISKLITDKNDSVFFKLMYSKSPIFNWFLAEFFNYNESKNNFLNLQQKEEIYNYNGRNGFNTFRSKEVLEKLYH
jgi:hypothetical protein